MTTLSIVSLIAHRSLAFYSGKSDNVLSDDVLMERIGFGFPPKFKKNDKVPYTVCLQKSYEAFRVFARKVVDVLSEDSETMEMFQHWCATKWYDARRIRSSPQTLTTLISSQP